MKTIAHDVPGDGHKQRPALVNGVKSPKSPDEGPPTGAVVQIRSPLPSDSSGDISEELPMSQDFRTLIENRVTKLEVNVRQILDKPEQGKVRALDQDLTSPTTLSDLHILPVIRESTWSEFRHNGWYIPEQRQRPLYKSSDNTIHYSELDFSKPRVMIEALIEQPGSAAPPRPVANIQRRKGSPSFALVDPATFTCEPQTRHFPYLIRLRSPLLMKVLRGITNMQVCIGKFAHVLLLIRPFKLLVNFANKIREEYKRLCGILTGEAAVVLQETETEKARECLQVLCDFLDGWLQPKVNMCFSPSENISTVTFDDLWYVFKPGAEIRTTGRDQIQLLRIIKVTGGRDNNGKDLSRRHSVHGSKALKQGDENYVPGSFIIECFFFHFNGHRYGPVNQTIFIPGFHGERQLMSLPVIPLECDPEKGQVREYLRNRASRFVKLANPRAAGHAKYCGQTLGTRQDNVDSSIIIDFELALFEMPDSKPSTCDDNLVIDHSDELRDPWAPVIRFGAQAQCQGPGCCGRDAVFDDYEVDFVNIRSGHIDNRPLLNPVEEVADLKDDQLVLLPPILYGFVLRTRKWATFDIDLVTEIDYANGWDRLVIEPEAKETILALVETHARPRGEEEQEKQKVISMDLVGGKGNGLIILLHGEPGVGKTSTAECVADHTKRPLFPITCGDIGDNAQLVETSLERNFQLAHRWGCVLLLDEADIFLSKRNNKDITRNAIVSVFLRTLEYYSGILFLTTNRVGTIDRAFRSRIHLSLYYRNLNKEKTLKIWKNNIDGLAAEAEKRKKTFDINRQEILEYAKELYRKTKEGPLRPWNGRQIRNAFQTAVAIAEFEATAHGATGTPRLGKSQFEKVAKSALDFESYLNHIYHGKNESHLAKENLHRADDWHEESKEKKKAQPIRAFGQGGRRGSRRRRRRGNDDDGGSDSDEKSAHSTSSAASASASASESGSYYRSSRRKSKRRERPAYDSDGTDDTDSNSRSRSKRQKKS